MGSSIGGRTSKLMAARSDGDAGRSRRLVNLTLPGQIFLQEARKTLAQAETAPAAARRAGRGETGGISIG